jgi:hypothetical protein
MRWKGEYDDPPFATHGENIRVHTFLWSDGQMTMGPRGAQQKEIKVLAICVVWCRQLRRSAGVSRAQRTSIVCNVQGIYTSSSVVALMSGARIDMFSLDSSTEHSATQISIFSSYRFPNIDVTNPTLPKKKHAHRPRSRSTLS